MAMQCATATTRTDPGRAAFYDRFMERLAFFWDDLDDTLGALRHVVRYTWQEMFGDSFRLRSRST